MINARPRRPALVLLFASALLSVFVHGASAVSVGTPFPAFSAADQHGDTYTFNPGTRLVFIAFEMDPAKQANQAFAEQDADFLPRHNAVFISNVHGMPAIGRVFAYRKMRKYPHRIVLADEAELLDPFPKTQGKVTVLCLNDMGTVTAIEFWDPTQAVTNFLR